MTKLEKKRDEIRPKDLHFREECEHFKCGAKDSWTEGFDASTAEWKRIVEPLVEALKFYKREHEHHKTHIFEQNKAEEALEKYYEEIN